MRRLADLLLAASSFICAGVSIGVLGFFIAYIAKNASKRFSLDFLLEESLGSGTSGGIKYQLAGTLILISASLLIALVVSSGVAIGLGCYLKHARLKRSLVALVGGFSTVPSIVWGLLGMQVLGEFLGLGKSWLAGAIVLALMISPVMTVVVTEAIGRVPVEYREAAVSLGLSAERTIWSVLVPYSRRSLFSGALLGIARVAGETAAVMMTAAVFWGASIPRGIRNSPVVILSYHIFVLAQDYIDLSARSFLWAAALVLLIVTSLFTILALALRSRSVNWLH